MKGVATIAEVNCDENSSLCQKEGVEGYPMLFFYRDSQKVEYKGQRSLGALEGFLTKFLSPGLQDVLSKDFEALVQNHPALYLYLYTFKTSKADLDNLEQATRPLMGHPPVYKSKDPDLWEKYALDPNAGPVLLAIKDHQSSPAAETLRLPSGINVAQTEQWFTRHKLPTVQELVSDTFTNIMKNPHSPLVVLAAVEPNRKAETERILLAAAKIWKTKGSPTQQPMYTWMDVDQWGSWLKKMYGLQKQPQGGVVVTNHQKLIYYNQDSDKKPIQLQESSIVSALDGIYSGKVPMLQSENMFERSIRSIHNGMTLLGDWVWAHPLITMSMIGGVLYLIFKFIKRALEDEDPRGVHSRLD
jgi:hypothetical protein